MDIIPERCLACRSSRRMPPANSYHARSMRTVHVCPRLRWRALVSVRPLRSSPSSSRPLLSPRRRRPRPRQKRRLRRPNRLAPAPAMAADRRTCRPIQSLDPSANDVGKAQSGSQGVGLARAARGAADLSHGRRARGGAGAGRHPAQRRGQGQPVFPARVQSGPRHGSGHHRRRHARQHAHARPRAGLRRYQLPDPRDRAGPRLPQGSLLRLRRRLRLGRCDLSRRGRPAGQELRPGRGRQLRP